MADFEEVVRRRRSYRSYLDKPVPTEKIERIKKTIQRVPTAGNLQAYKVSVVHDQELKEKLTKISFDQSFIAEAPVVMVFWADTARSALKYAERGRDFFSIQDATIATAYAQLAIENEGLKSVWVGAFEEDDVREVMGEEDLGMKPVAIIPIGYSEGETREYERRPLEELFEER